TQMRAGWRRNTHYRNRSPRAFNNLVRARVGWRLPGPMVIFHCIVKPRGRSVILAIVGRPPKRLRQCGPTARGNAGGGSVVGPPHGSKECVMDWNRIEGNWKQFKGKAKEKWGRLTDD